MGLFHRKKQTISLDELIAYFVANTGDFLDDPVASVLVAEVVGGIPPSVLSLAAINASISAADFSLEAFSPDGSVIRLAGDPEAGDALEAVPEVILIRLARRLRNYAFVAWAAGHGHSPEDVADVLSGIGTRPGEIDDLTGETAILSADGLERATWLLVGAWDTDGVRDVFHLMERMQTIPEEDQWEVLRLALSIGARLAILLLLGATTNAVTSRMDYLLENITA